MNKIYLSIAVTMAAAVALMIVLVVTKSDMTHVQSRDSNQSVSQPQVPRSTAKSSPAPVLAGKYIAYDQATFDATTGTRLLFFHASWCSQCQALDKSITAQPKLADSTTIFKVNYDTQNDLRVKYGVTLQTTIVKVDTAGNKLDSFVAYREPSYNSVAQHFALQ